MFKYIKKLTSVVVMFAVIIVFSSSNVYAVEVEANKDQSYNPFFLLFWWGTLHEQKSKIFWEGIRTEQGNQAISDALENDEMLDMLDEMKTGVKSTKYDHMSLSIKLSQGDMQKYFDSKENEETGKYELTAKGMADFEAAKARGGDGGDGGGDGM